MKELPMWQTDNLPVLLNSRLQSLAGLQFFYIFVTMKIKIKNMVCRHCVAKVAEVASSVPELNLNGVELGSVTVNDDVTDDVVATFDSKLRPEGFEVIRSRDDSVVEDIKRRLITLSRSGEGAKADIEKELTSAIPLSYRSLSRIFASVEGRTIENYFTALRVERIKELLLENRLSLSEIAFETGFSSVPHLSNRFKQATGLTPTQFRSIGVRTPLPEV